MNKKITVVIKGRQLGWTNWIKNYKERYDKMTPEEAFQEMYVGQFPKEQN